MKSRKDKRRYKIKLRIRKKISGTSERPRLTVFRSNKEIYAQIVDDLTGKTIVGSSSMIKEIAAEKLTKSEKAKLVGKTLAAKAIEAGVNAVVFDRNGYLYHGRVKALAEAVREGGLKF
ncbi:MAG: 50S ribosomal protein L18 [Bacteroidales bacterium]|nr:50S ribosomal protein L18 [Bacteroidales bacterium]